MKTKEITFTHYWVSGFGWENTIFVPSDFVTVEKLGYNGKDGFIFIGINESDGKHILKGHYNMVHVNQNPDDRGGTGHGDISYSDADSGL